MLLFLSNSRKDYSLLFQLAFKCHGHPPNCPIPGYEIAPIYVHRRLYKGSQCLSVYFFTVISMLIKEHTVCWLGTF